MSDLRIEEEERYLRLQLHLVCPDARQCKNCSYGPLFKYGCSTVGKGYGSHIEALNVSFQGKCPACQWDCGDIEFECLPLWMGNFSDTVLGDLRLLATDGGTVEQQLNMTKQSSAAELAVEDLGEDLGPVLRPTSDAADLQSNLRRGFSDGSRNIIERFAESEELVNMQHITFALHAIASAHIVGSITLEEKEILKSSVQTGHSCPEGILSKISPGHRQVLLSLLGTESEKASAGAGAAIIDKSGIDPKAIWRVMVEAGCSKEAAVKSLSKKHVSSSSTCECQICGSSDAATPDDSIISCMEGHVFHKSCLTDYGNMFSNTFFENFSEFQICQGDYCCAYVGTNSAQCRARYEIPPLAIFDCSTSFVESYIMSRMRYVVWSLYGEFSSQLLNYSKLEISAEQDKAATITKEREKARSHNLSLRLLYPDARACIKCGFGPMINLNCDSMVLSRFIAYIVCLFV